MWLRFSLTLMFSLVFSSSVSAKKIDDEDLFDPDHLVNIEIKLPAEDWDVLRKQVRTRPLQDPAEEAYTVYKADLWIDGVRISSVGIRKKGFIGSSNATYPSLKIKFDEFVDQDPIKNLDRLTLNNNKQDRGVISQAMTYYLFNRVGIEAPRCNFARVTVNGNYLGIYSNVEAIRKPFLQQRFGEKSGNLYEGTVGDFYPPAVDFLQLKTNKKENDRTHARRLAEILNQESPTLAEIATLVDIDAFLKYWAMESMIGHWDSYTGNQNNYYSYFHPKNEKFYFIPWGTDASFTNGRGPFDDFRLRRIPLIVYTQAWLPNQLYHCEGIPERYRETVEQILNDHWDVDVLTAEVDRMEKLIGEHLHPRQRSAPNTIAKYRSYMKTRPEEIRATFEKQWPIEVKTYPRKPMFTVDRGTFHGKFTAAWNEEAKEKSGELTDLQLVMDSRQLTLQSSECYALARRATRGTPFGGAFPDAVNLVCTVMKEDDSPLEFHFPVVRESFADNLGKPIRVFGTMFIGKQQPPRGIFRRRPKRESLPIEGVITFTAGKLEEVSELTGQFEVKVVQQRGLWERPESRAEEKPSPTESKDVKSETESETSAKD